MTKASLSFCILNYNYIKTHFYLTHLFYLDSTWLIIMIWWKHINIRLYNVLKNWIYIIYDNSFNFQWNPKPFLVTFSQREKQIAILNKIILLFTICEREKLKKKCEMGASWNNFFKMNITFFYLYRFIKVFPISSRRKYMFWNQHFVKNQEN